MRPTYVEFLSLHDMLQALGNTRQVETLMEVFEAAWARAAADGNKLDSRILSGTVSVLCRVKALRRALGIAHRMNSQGIPMDRYLYTSLINGCAMVGSVEEAQQLFKEMEHKGIRPDSAAFTALIKAYCIGSSLEEALTLVDTMEASGVAPEEVTWTTLAKSARSQGRSDVLDGIEERRLGRAERLKGALEATKLATVGAGFADESDDDMLGF